MNISNEESIVALIDVWRETSAYLQEKNMRIARDTIDLNMMYYEQKGNERGILRMKRCLDIIEKFKCDLEQQKI